MPPSTLGILSALAAALTWGGADYLGGFVARRLKSFQVLLLIALGGLAIVLILALAAGESWPSPSGLLYATVAGISGSLGITALYRGLTLGNTAFVAPLAAIIGAAVPVLYEIGRGNPPSPAQLSGFILALSGIWLVSRNEHEHPSARFAGWGLATIAGFGFGGFFVLIARAANDGVFTPLVVVKCVTILMALLVLAFQRERPPSPLRHPLALLGGLLDASGNALYVLATQLTRLDIAAVLASMSPAVVVLLARTVTHETITRWQWLGVGVCLASIALITI